MVTLSSPSLPAIATGFVRKLYRILDQESDAVISWDADGASFSIHDGDRLERLVLPRYFRGRLFAFRQQLSEHGFQRLGAPIESYRHEAFLRGCPDRLSAITRIPQPRRRPSRRKPVAKRGDNASRAVEPGTTKIAPLKDPKGSHHRVNPYPVSTDKAAVHAKATKTVDVTGNPLFAPDEGGALAEFLAPMSLDGVKHSLDFAVSGAGPMLDAGAPAQQLSEDTMNVLMQLLDDSRSVDDVSGKPKSNSRNIFESSDSTTVVLPPMPRDRVEYHQFSSDTMDLMMNWLSGDGTQGSSTQSAKVGD